jgi:hypothetical protein
MHAYYTEYRDTFTAYSNKQFLSQIKLESKTLPVKMKSDVGIAIKTIGTSFTW